jgi:hypothetical protein
MADDGMIKAPASLRYKLTFASLIATVAALLTSGVLFMGFLYKWGIDDIVADLQIKAEVVSANSRAALAFGDAIYASETLQAFSLAPDISEAALILPDGEVLALYRPVGAAPDIAVSFVDLQPGMTIADGHILLYQPVVLDGEVRVLKLTLGALAELEAALEADTLVALVERFEGGAFSTRDVLALIVAGLRGGGWDGTAGDLLRVEIGGGPVEAAKVAGQLLVRAFSVAEV